MQNEDINIENLTIDIFVDDQKDANAFLNQSVEEIKKQVLPEIEKQLLEMNLISGSTQSVNVESVNAQDLDFGTIELDIVAQKTDWKEVLRSAISEKIIEEVAAHPLSEEAFETHVLKGEDQKKAERLESFESAESDNIRASADESSIANTASLIEIFIDFLRTGILPARKGALKNIASLAELEAKISDVDTSRIWSRLIPVFKRNKKAVVRFSRQRSSVLWNKVVTAQFSSEVQQFINTWIEVESVGEEKIKRFLLEFAVAEPTVSNPSLGFSVWKDKSATFLAENYSKEEVLELFRVGLKMDTKTNERRKNKIEKETAKEFQKQWKGITKAILDKLGVSAMELEQLSTELTKKSELAAKDFKVEKGTEKIRIEKKGIEEKATERTEFVLPDQVLIENAGIVLLQPFFPSVFKNLELLNEKNQWVDEEAQVKAIYTLHYLATGELEVSEDQLLIEKLLTGFPLDEVIPLVEEEDILTDELNVQMAELLDVIHDNWKPMRNCTWVGLRNDFLTRSAELEQIDDLQYKLIIEPHFLDVLLPSKNWGISMVKYSWMEGFVFVEWGNLSL
ncbi:MAG: hypothetical protein ACJA1C_001818 [Crocinitomicaceae bacterium]|jgi:hypothetical protein